MSGERDEYTRSPERQAIIDALLADRRRRLAKLCKRLNIPNDWDYGTTWQLVGWELAQKEPEFGPGRGRPKLADPLDGIDAQRAAFVIEAAESLAQDPKMPRLSIINWIQGFKRTVRERPGDMPIRRLFGQTKTALLRSVKKGMNHHDVPEGLFAKK